MIFVDFEYHQVVWIQVLEILGFVCLLTCLVMQIYKETSGQVEKYRPLMTVAVIALLAFSGDYWNKIQLPPAK